MTLLAFGINHKTAPVEIRERVAFQPEQVGEALRDLLAHAPVSEAAIISTCNRTELICQAESPDANAIIEWFRQYHKLGAEEVAPYIYAHPDSQAVRHILRVASGLDSLVLGEPQILGQIKDAYHTASDAGTIGRLLNRLFQYTFSVAKQVRSDTAIGANPVSVAFAAVSLSRQIFSDLGRHTALLIGAGETIELVARHLREQGIKRMIIANRTVERARQLSRQIGGEAIVLADVPQALADADIVISSTASPLPILGKGMVERALRQRKHRPMFMVDIAVPRDIEPEAGELNDVYLYTVDDLHAVIEENRRSRAAAAAEAEEIIDNQVEQFMGWLRSLDAVQTIRHYREQAEHIRDDTLADARRQLAAGKDPEEVLNELARLLTSRLIHSPTAQLNRAAFEGRKDVLAIARELLDLKDTND
ncbi:MAG TPA: glutamyl-tRNA reductase [Gammaproteobacteria bacterium]|nr:glutamyl-tRNA reductase [Gammaproteobacteria bacterium]